MKKKARKRVVRYGSEMLPQRMTRRRVKALLRRGREPQPRYRSGKFWMD